MGSSGSDALSGPARHIASTLRMIIDDTAFIVASPLSKLPAWSLDLFPACRSSPVMIWSETGHPPLFVIVIIVSPKCNWPPAEGNVQSDNTTGLNEFDNSLGLDLTDEFVGHHVQPCTIPLVLSNAVTLLVLLLVLAVPPR